MRYFFLLALAASALLLAACSGAEEEVPQDASQAMASAAASPGPGSTDAWTAPAGTPVSAPGWTTVRFWNVTVSVPDGVVASPLAGYTFSPTDFYNRPVIVVEPRGDDYLRVVIDAETGTIVDETGSEQERAVLQPALDTVRLSQFDPKAAPWPYADTTPPEQRGGWGSITWPIPDSLSGIGVGMAVGDGGSPGQCNMTIFVGNGRSKMGVSACTGEPFLASMDIHPEDKDAFQRFLKAIEVKP